ncbi:hypothetical protein B0H16DRAFT_1625165 [Mycena metata]|uniref:NmrA-like domain-containing protein n=1 Tax=Mycena metata TaxID=1033252 RepID=A0AAD7H5H3_9AGAR|nr:hypothetical protein B0H16DRAFT_1625165 [Mycena metata]
MASARIVSVFGAPGTQGSAVVRALLKDATFAPRAICLDPDSDAAQKLKAQGVEVVKGDFFNKASLVNALRGSEAVFSLAHIFLHVTVPIFPFKAEGPNELVAGMNMVDAAKEVGVKFFIFSSLPSISKISAGKYNNALHYDQKAAVEEHLRSSGLANASIHTGAFLERYWTFVPAGLLNRTVKGFDMAVPLFRVADRAAFTWVERDLAAVVLALLTNYTDPSKNISGKVYPIVNANIPYAKLAEMTGKALGVEVTFTTAPPKGMAAMDDMYAAHAEYSGLYTATPIPNPDLVALGVQLGTIEDFLEAEVKPRFG